LDHVDCSSHILHIKSYQAISVDPRVHAADELTESRNHPADIIPLQIHRHQQRSP